MSDRHVVVFSADALVYEDLETLSKLFVFEPIWQDTARVDRVKSIYPSVTYPCHTTMMTGVYPNKHGVVNNEKEIMCQGATLWHHDRKYVKAPTVFDLAKANGLTTAGIFWPVTGNDPSIDYLVDEVWPQHGESTEQCFIDFGSSPEVMEKIVKPNMSMVDKHHREHPYADVFTVKCACDIIREFKPNLTMIHPANIDAARHKTGLFTQHVEGSLHETNLWIGELLIALEDAGIRDKTDFFLVSDHGQLEVRRNIAVNALLAENGLIDVAEDGTIRDYIAFARSAGLSAHVYLKNPDSKADADKTYAVLKKLVGDETSGFSRVFTAEEADAEEHLAGRFSFVLEGDDYTSFNNGWTRPLVKSLDNRNYRFGRATHGHLPHKGPQPTLVAFGPHMKKGAVISNANLVDEAPTIAHALGLKMENTDGRVLTELFDE